jgi:hypothetical protein
MESLKISSKINLHTSHIRKQKANLFSLINYHSKQIVRRGIASKEDIQVRLQVHHGLPLTIDKLQAQLNELKNYSDTYSFNWTSNATPNNRYITYAGTTSTNAPIIYSTGTNSWQNSPQNSPMSVIMPSMIQLSS